VDKIVEGKLEKFFNEKLPAGAEIHP